MQLYDMTLEPVNTFLRRYLTLSIKHSRDNIERSARKFPVNILELILANLANIRNHVCNITPAWSELFERETIP